MKALVIGHLTGKDIKPHHQAEGRRVAELRSEGVIRDVFLTAGRTRADPGPQGHHRRRRAGPAGEPALRRARTGHLRLHRARRQQSRLTACDYPIADRCRYRPAPGPAFRHSRFAPGQPISAKDMPGWM